MLLALYLLQPDKEVESIEHILYFVCTSIQLYASLSVLSTSDENGRKHGKRFNRISKEPQAVLLMLSWLYVPPSLLASSYSSIDCYTVRRKTTREGKEVAEKVGGGGANSDDICSMVQGN